MLFSNYLDNVPKFSEFADSLSIERCYQSLCQRLNVSASACSTVAASGRGQCVTQTKHQLHHNQNRTRWKIRRQTQMPTRLPHQKPANHQRTFAPHSINAVVLFFIVLLSHDQMTTAVYGASSRDSSNSIYQSNNPSVNNVTKNDLNASSSAAIDGNIVENHIIDDELPAADLDFVANITSEADFERFLSKIEYSRSHKSRPSTIYQNEFAVYIPSGIETADGIAAKHGFTNMGQVSSS